MPPLAVVFPSGIVLADKVYEFGIISSQRRPKLVSLWVVDTPVT